MKQILARASLVLLLATAVPASAYRLDEYLQASTFSVDRSHVQVFLRLVPGVSVAPDIVAEIDTNHDGVLSPEEQRAYVQRVVHDLSLKREGQPLQLQPVTWEFPPVDDMEAGLGEIQITLQSALPLHAGAQTLTFEDRFRPDVSAYMTNALAPADKTLEIASEERSQNQSVLHLQLVDTTQPGKGETFRLGRAAEILLVTLGLGPLLTALYMWRALRETDPSRPAGAGRSGP